MSLPRFAAWGAGRGFLLAGVFAWAPGLRGEFLVPGPVLATAGAVCAAGSSALARMATDPELLDAGADLDEARLAEDEMRDLPGDGS